MKLNQQTTMEEMTEESAKYVSVQDGVVGDDKTKFKKNNNKINK